MSPVAHMPTINNNRQVKKQPTLQTPLRQSQPIYFGVWRDRHCTQIISGVCQGVCLYSGYLTSILVASHTLLKAAVFFFCYCCFLFVCLFSELRTEPRALRLLGKLSTTELNPQPLQCFYKTFWITVHSPSKTEPEIRTPKSQG